MKSDKEILVEMIFPEALVALETEYEKSTVVLKEEGVRGSEVCIRNIPTDSVVIKADNFPAPTKFFNGEQGECKRADFIIISTEKKVIIYIELKAGQKSGCYIVKQLKGASCLVSYCQEIAKQFWNKDDFLAGYQQRYIGLTHLSINKRSSRLKLAELHDSPDSFLKISSPNKKYLQFQELARV